MQKHDGVPERPEDEYKEDFEPVRFATVNVFDDDGTYQENNKNIETEAETGDGERKDYD